MKGRRDAQGILKAERLGVPPAIIIDNHQYTFKELLKNGKLAYRCRTYSCGVGLTVTRGEMEKFMNNSSIRINYDLNRQHTCSGVIYKRIDIEEVTTDYFEKGKSLILAALDKPLSWHINNLNEYNILLTPEQIKDILYREYDKKYVNESECLSNITKVTLNLDEENLLLKNMPFCFAIKKIINPNKNNRQEKFIIFTSLYQVKYFVNSTEIYTDINYKICPNGYYQILNIISYNKDIKKYLPVFTIPMTFKSKLAYINIFRTIIKIIKNNRLSFEQNNIIFICEFERDIRDAIKEVFPNNVIKGNYFHYIKKLWKKAKKCGLCLKDRMKYTKPIILALFFIVLLKKDKINKIFNDIVEYINTTPDEYKPSYEKFISFYKDKFLKSKYIHFDSIKNENEWFYRTNNICELFHGSLSNSIEYLFPKMSLFISKVQEIIMSYQKQFETEANKNDEINEDENNNIIINKEENNIDEDDYFDDDNYDDEMVNIEDFNTFEDIYKFVYDYHQSEKKEINFKSLFELDNNFKFREENIIINNLKYLFGLKCISDVENKKNLSTNVYNFDEIEQVLADKKNHNKTNKKKKNNEDNEEENEEIDYSNYQPVVEVKNYNFIDYDSDKCGNKTDKIKIKFDCLYSNMK